MWNLIVEQALKYIHTYIYIERERETWLFLEGFEYESLSLKFNVMVFKYNIHHVEVDLHCYECLKTKIQVF